MRAHNYITAKTYLRDAPRARRDDPASRRSKMDAKFLRRLGFDLEKLAGENLVQHRKRVARPRPED